MEEKKKNNGDLRMLGEIMKYFKPHKKYIIIASITTIISVLLSMPIPYLNKILVDDIILGKRYSLFGIVMAVWLVILIVQPLLNSFTKYIFSIFDMNFDLGIKTDIFTKILRLPVDFFTNNQLGYVQGRIDNDISSLHSVTAGKILNILSNIIMLLFGLIMMFFIDWKLTILTLIIIPINIINSFYFANRVRGVNKQVSEAWSRQGGKMFEFLMGIETVKLFVFERQSMKAYREKYKEAIGVTKRKVKLDLISNYFSSIAAGLSSFIIWGYGGWLIIKGHLTIGEITAFVGYTEYVFSPAIQMAGLKLNLQSVFASWDRIKEILDLEDEKMISDSKAPLQITEGKIQYQNVSFQFEDGEQLVLNDITTDIKALEKVTLAGNNGSGKSTFIKLLVGFFPNYTGTILIDGQDISKCSIYSIREQITIVSQYVFLFYGTILDNIKMLDENITNEEVKEVAEHIQLDKFINTLPEGYNFIVQENGANLSGGQKQLISIARALLRKKTKIIIFDEATSALDVDIEKHICDNIDKICKGKTFISITHRKSFSAVTDRVIQFEEGKIIE